MMFVFELGCEELPSSSLPSLNSQFEQLFTQKLNDALLGYESLSVIAAPRRLGVVIEGVKEASEDKPFERKGPAFQAAFQGDEPTKALLGFCRGLNISPEHTSVVDTDKGQWVVYRGIEAGKPASEVLGDVCQSVIADQNQCVGVVVEMNFRDQYIGFWQCLIMPSCHSLYSG